MYPNRSARRDRCEGGKLCLFSRFLCLFYLLYRFLDLPHRLNQPRICLAYSIPDSCPDDAVEEDEGQEPQTEEEEEIREEECVAHGIIPFNGG